LLLASSPRPPRTSPHTPKTPAEATGDSLYDAGAIDSLLAFSNRMIARSAGERDSVLMGRMVYFRGRARLALRDARAPEDFDRALAIATALGDSAGRMQALGLQAFVAVNRGEFEESIRLNRERNALARGLKRRGSEGWGYLLIGYAQLNRDSLPPALAAYEEAWRAFGDVNRPRDQLTASIGLGRTLDRMGRYHDARTSYQRAWLVARELGDRNQESDAINNLGAIEMEQGSVSMAAQYFERAYEIKRDLRTFDIATSAANVANVDRMIGRYAHAESTLAEAMAMQNNNMLDAAIALDIGSLRLAQGRYPSAARSFREVIARGDRLPAHHRPEANTLLAQALLASDSVAAAIAVIDAGTNRISGDPPSAWRARAWLVRARAHRLGGDALQARDAAMSAWQDAVARNDSSLMVTVASELSLCERAALREPEAWKWLERGRATFEVSRDEGEFQWREARRAALAGSLLESGDLLRVYPADASEETRMRALFDFLQLVQSRTLLERVTDPRRFDDVDPALAHPPTSRELQEHVLRPGECFFRASVVRGHVYVFAVSRDDFRAAVIDDPDGSLERRALNYARLCARPPASADGNDVSDAGRALGVILFGPTAQTVRASEKVYAALDGFLAGFPLETLVCPGENQPLVVTHEAVRIPSAAFLAYLRARPGPRVAGSPLLAVAPDTRTLPGAREEVDHLASRYGATRTLAPARNEFLAALSGYDVVHIASHVHVDGERPWNSGVLIGRSEAPAATAAPANDSAPAQPLVLSAAESEQVAAHLPDDPFVRASEIANRRTSARLVVLSACESALGRSTMAEGVLGIASSFVSAGSRAVVASLWQVDDRTTAKLMEYFYRELASGRTVAAALHRAQLGVRREKPAPFFWAGFVVIGDGNLTIPLQVHRPWLTPSLTAAGLMIVFTWSLAVWLRRKRRVRMAP
jgi:tetratricopeptide (TPR) repeat protein